MANANLHQARLTGADLRYATLKNANFREANLDGAVIRDTDCSHTNFAGASLMKTSFRFANLSNANLNQANLTQAKLEASNLSHADLRGASFEGANLAKSNLNGADLGGTILLHSNLEGIDLSQVKTFFVSGSFENTKLLMIELDRLRTQIEGHPQAHDLRHAIANEIVRQAEDRLELINLSISHPLFAPKNIVKKGIALLANLSKNDSPFLSGSQEILVNAKKSIEQKMKSINKK